VKTQLRDGDIHILSKVLGRHIFAAIGRRRA